MSQCLTAWEIDHLVLELGMDHWVMQCVGQLVGKQPLHAGVKLLKPHVEGLPQGCRAQIWNYQLALFLDKWHLPKEVDYARE